jgi:tetratricopeptide (TPR) repeat protein
VRLRLQFIAPIDTMPRASPAAGRDEPLTAHSPSSVRRNHHDDASTDIIAHGTAVDHPGGKSHFRDMAFMMKTATSTVIWMLVPLLVLHLDASGQPSPALTNGPDWHKLGDQAASAADYSLALRFYEVAYDAGNTDLGLLTRIASVSNDLAYSFLAEGDRQSAESHYELALEYAHKLYESFPERAESHVVLALSSAKLAQFKGGRDKVRIGRRIEELCLSAINLDSTYAPAHALLGVFYREVSGLSWIERAAANALLGGIPDGSLEEAARLLERAIRLDPEMPCAHWELSQTYSRMGRHDDARVHLAKCVELEPKNSEDIRTQAQANRLLSRSL